MASAAGAILAGLALIVLAYAASQAGQNLVQQGVQQAIADRRQYYLTG